MDGATDAAPCTPAPEVCDGRDNDCDGDVDEDFNLMADPANCGACGNA
ncbi:MAG: lipoprotein receptor, partial [Deltaproteobacteria bacterium]